MGFYQYLCQNNNHSCSIEDGENADRSSISHQNQVKENQALQRKHRNLTDSLDYPELGVVNHVCDLDRNQNVDSANNEKDDIPSDNLPESPLSDELYSHEDVDLSVGVKISCVF